MVRDDDDSWGVDETVGATALGAAAVRAFEAVADSPLFTDPYAQFFIDAAAEAGITTKYGGIRAEEFSDPALADFVRSMSNFAASRTKYFDDFFSAAVGAGVRQFVGVAAGLDTRAWRLSELGGCTVYEIDQPGVLQFKADTLRTRGGSPTATYVAVPIDLRDDWPTALRQAGFRDSEPTGWSIEGLLPYLPPDAQNGLFEHICTLSAPGSHLVVDAYRPQFYGETMLHTTFEQMDRAVRSDPSSDNDTRIYSEDLFFTGVRADVAEWLTEHSWITTSVPSVDAMARFGRPAAPTVDAATLSSDFVKAQLSPGERRP
jgi:methyltransferase (TIGR00027 family)